MIVPERHEAGPGQESVWDYPRPPRLEASDRHLQVVHGGVVVADTRSAWRVLETSHPPVYYLPPEDVRMDLLEPVDGASSSCEWKGRASYFDVKAGERTAPRAAFRYDAPVPGFEPIAGHVAFYAAALDRCTVDREVVQPQPGSFYAGWITNHVVGPFKGGPGTMGW